MINLILFGSFFVMLLLNIPHPAVRRSLLPDPLRSHPGEDGESGSGGPGKGHQGHVLMPVEKEIFKYGN